MLNRRAMCRVNPDPALQGRRSDPAARQISAPTRPDPSVGVISGAHFQKLTDLNTLLAAVKKLRASSGWKNSVQKVTSNALQFCNKLRNELISGSYRPQEGDTFIINERGHERLIRALHPADMVLQHALCDGVLIPALKPYLIHDNGASIKGKGMAFTQKRLMTHLRRFYAKHGTNGYILQIDFQKFFDNIPHEKLIAAYDAKLHDPKVKALLALLLDQYSQDVSYSDADFDVTPFNSMADFKVDPALKTGRRILHRSVGIGAPVSQITGIFYPTPIDTYCKVVRGCKFYARYMDDIYIIHESRDFLQDVLSGVKAQAETLGLFVHPEKTHITPLSQGFTFLKTRYTLTASGKVIRRLCRETVTRERHKLKTLYGLARQGLISKPEFYALYFSWRGDKNRFNCHKTLNQLDQLFRSYYNALSD